MSEAIFGLIVLLGAIILFVTRIVPAPVTALLGCAAFALFGACTVPEAFSGFSDSVVILVASMMVVGGAMRNTGVSKHIGNFVLRCSRNRERRFVLIGGATAALMSVFFSNTAVDAMLFTVIDAAADADKKVNRKNLVLPIALCTMFGGVCTLVGSTTQLTAQGILRQETGTALGLFDFTLPGLILLAVCGLYVFFLGYPMGKRIWGAREDRGDACLTSKDTSQPTGRKKLTCMLVILAGMLVCFIGGWVSISLVALLAALLCIVCGCVDFKTAIKEINWSVIFLLAGCLGITKGLSACGTDALLSEAVASVLGTKLPALVIFGIFVSATMLVSNFISNSGAVILFLPIAISLCQSMNFNVKTFTLGIVFAASLSFSTPLANAQMGMTLSAGYRFSDYIRYTWLLNILVLAAIVLCFPLLMPLTAI